MGIIMDGIREKGTHTRTVTTIAGGIVTGMGITIIAIATKLTVGIVIAITAGTVIVIAITKGVITTSQ